MIAPDAIGHQPDDRLEQRRLAGAVGADDRHGLGTSDVEIDSEQRLEVAVARRRAPRRPAGLSVTGQPDLGLERRRRGRPPAPHSTPSLREDRPRSACGRRRRPSCGRPRGAGRGRCARSTRSRRRSSESPRSCSTSSSTSASVSPPAISSSSSMLGCVASARASSRRLRSSNVSVPASDVGLVGHPGALEGLDGGLVGRPADAPTGAERAADEHVLEHREPLERARDLGVRPMPDRHRACAGWRVTSTPARSNRAAVGAQVSGDEVQQRRLARAIRAHDAEGLSLGNVEREVLDHVEAAESLRDVDDFEQSRHWEWVRSAAGGRRSRGSPATACCS